jgi:DNA repair photolyase
MIREIQAKTLLSRVRGEDDWFGLYYNLNLYRGCQHQCIYCDSRSECYQIEDFNHDVLVKANAIELLRRELPGKRVIGTIGTGSMNDPYMPLEKQFHLTRRALQVIREFRFPVHIITKSDLPVRDLDLLADIQADTYAAVTFTITTADDDLSRKLEPGAPVSSRRLAAMQELSRNGILVGVTLMPVLPFIEDTGENIRRVVELSAGNGARYILPAFSVTLRDRQRAYFYAQLDRDFTGLRMRYERAFGQRYAAHSPHTTQLEEIFSELCERYHLERHMPRFNPRPRCREGALQLPLFVGMR